MRSTTALLAILYSLLACGPEATDPTGDVTGSTTSPEATSMPTASENGDPCTLEAIQELGTMCASIAERGACEATRLGNECAWCFWTEWVPVSFDADTCVFGPPEGRCYSGMFGDACEFSGHPCSERGTNLFRRPDGRVGFGESCAGPEDGELCRFDSETMDVNHPECACACAEDFPWM